MFFLMFRENILCFSLCPLHLFFSLGTTVRSLALSSDTCTHWWDSPWSFCRLNSASFLTLDSLKKFFGLLIIFVAHHWTVSNSSILPLSSGAQNKAQYFLRCGLSSAGSRQCCSLFYFCASITSYSICPTWILYLYCISWYYCYSSPQTSFLYNLITGAKYPGYKPTFCP